MMGTIWHEAERAQHDMQRLFNVFGASGTTIFCTCYQCAHIQCKDFLIL